MAPAVAAFLPVLGNCACVPVSWACSRRRGQSGSRALNMDISSETLSLAQSADSALESLQLPIPAAVLDLGMTIQWVNRTACEKFRLSPATLIGRSWYQWFPEARSRMVLHQELARGERSFLDLPCVPMCTSRHGTHYVSCKLRPLKAADGSVAAIIGLAEDVTSFVLAGQLAAENAERFRVVATGSMDLILITTVDGTITFVNEAGMQTLAPGSGLGNSVFDNVHPNDHSRFKEMFHMLLHEREQNAQCNVEIRKKHADGTWHWFDLVATNMLNSPAVCGLVLSGRDITERKDLEHRLAEAVNHEQDRIGQHLHDGLGQELAGISMMIRSVANGLKRANPWPPEYAAAALEEALKHVSHTIKGIRTIARGLAPVRDDRGGLIQALRILAAEATANLGCRVTFRALLAAPLSLDEAVATHLFRIAQEVIADAIRRRKSTRIGMRLTANRDEVRLNISDDARVPSSRRRKASIKMSERIIAYRAQAIDGQLRVGRSRAGGTHISIVVAGRTRSQVGP